jgi:hypothetical protein
MRGIDVVGDKTEMKEQRIAIVFPNTSFDTVPSLYGAAVLLSKHGYLVDIFTSGSVGSTHL